KSTTPSPARRQRMPITNTLRFWRRSHMRPARGTYCLYGREISGSAHPARVRTTATLSRAASIWVNNRSPMPTAIQTMLPTNTIGLRIMFPSTPSRGEYWSLASASHGSASPARLTTIPTFTLALRLIGRRPQAMKGLVEAIMHLQHHQCEPTESAQANEQHYNRQRRGGHREGL